MNNKALFIILAGLIMSPACCGITYLLDTGLPKDRPFGKFLIFALLAIGFLWLMRTVGFTLWKRFHSSKAAEKLAKEMGLNPLIEKDNPRFNWYGGTFQGYDYAITPTLEISRYHLEGESRVRFTYYLRTVLASKRATPLNTVVHRTPKDRGKAATFEKAFPKQENADTLPATTKQAMLDFIKKGYPSNRFAARLFGPGIRNLRLHAPADAQDRMIERDVFPETAVLLIHDHPDPILVTPDQLQAVLADMIEVAEHIETLP